MTALRFGTGWRDTLGRERTLLWLSDPGWICWDNGQDVTVIRRGVHDEVAVRARLLGWQDYVDDRDGSAWVESQLWTSPSLPRQGCPVCQGEGWVAGPEGYAVLCGCGDEDFL